MEVQICLRAREGQKGHRKKGRPEFVSQGADTAMLVGVMDEEGEQQSVKNR